MQDKTIAIIGAGSIGGETVLALYGQGHKNIIASGRDEKRLSDLHARCPEITVTNDNVEAASAADIVILSVKPKIIPLVCEEIQDAVHGKLVLSMAAATLLSTITPLLPGSRVARIMTGVFVADEIAAYSPSDECTEEDEDAIRHIYGAGSRKLPEALLSCRAYIGSDTGLIPKQIHEKITVLQELGMSQEDANAFYAGTLRAIADELERGSSGEDILSRVGGPGSYTLGLSEKLEEAGVYELMRDLVREMVSACRNE